jgi:hypothetical protein
MQVKEVQILPIDFSVALVARADLPGLARGLSYVNCLLSTGNNGWAGKSYRFANVRYEVSRRNL